MFWRILLCLLLNVVAERRPPQSLILEAWRCYPPLPRLRLVRLLSGALSLPVNRSLWLVNLAGGIHSNIVVLDFPPQMPRVGCVVFDDLDSVSQNIVPSSRNRFAILFPGEPVAVKGMMVTQKNGSGSPPPIMGSPYRGGVFSAYASGEAPDKKSTSCAARSKPDFAPTESASIAESIEAIACAGAPARKAFIVLGDGT